MRFLDLEQGSPDWLAYRMNCIGGSDAPAILDCSPYLSRQELLHEKVTGQRRESNFAMRRGNRLEPLARAKYASQYTDLNVIPACVLHDDYDWMLSSLDGITWWRGVHVPQWLAEIKCWKWQNHKLCLAGKVPEEAYPQIQHQLMTTGLDLCDLISYSEHSSFTKEQQLVIVRVEANAEYQAMLFEKEEEFWAEVLKCRSALGVAA